MNKPDLYKGDFEIIAACTPEDYWGDYSKEDFLTPRVNIGQGSPTTGKLGHFNFSTGESVEVLHGCTFLARSNGFVLYSGLGKKPPLCKSDDGISPNVADPVWHECATCFAKEWGKDERKDHIKITLALPLAGEKPICIQTVSIMLVDHETVPFILDLKSHNVKVVKKLLTSLRMKSVAYKLPPFGVSFDLALKALPGMGNRFELTVVNFKKLEPGEVEMRANLYEMFGRRVKEIVNQVANEPQDEDLPF